MKMYMRGYTFNKKSEHEQVTVKLRLSKLECIASKALAWLAATE
jgi:hypothetical protein